MVGIHGNIDVADVGACCAAGTCLAGGALSIGTCLAVAALWDLFVAGMVIAGAVMTGVGFGTGVGAPVGIAGAVILSVFGTIALLNIMRNCCTLAGKTVEQLNR